MEREILGQKFPPQGKSDSALQKEAFDARVISLVAVKVTLSNNFASRIPFEVYNVLELSSRSFMAPSYIYETFQVAYKFSDDNKTFEHEKKRSCTYILGIIQRKRKSLKLQANVY